MIDKLSEEDLNKLQEMHSQFTKLKISLGDLELEKNDILDRIKNLKMLFSQNEKEIISKYGSDAVINIKTGDITRKN